VDQVLVQVYQTLQKLVGLHRQLLDVVRVEREVLVQADLPGIQNAALTKQSLIEEIKHFEAQRVKQTGELALIWKVPLRELTLPNIIVFVQGVDAKTSEQLRTIFNVLTVLIQRITEQNQANMALVEKSLEHVHQMKKNILGEANPQSITYGHQGQKVTSSQASRLISREV
jgi:flagellar biosynthesis/type III secretory pathway chaperone